MSRYSRGLLIVLTLATLTACGPADTPEPTPTTTETGAAPPAAAAPLPTGGKCVLITKEKAAELVGSAVTSSSSNVTGEAGMVRIDGCTFVGATSNLGYDINDLKGAGGSPASIVAQAKTAMAAQPGVVAFDVSGGDASVAFTVPVGPKVMARVEVAKGTYLIAVNSTAADAETGKKISSAALAILLAAIG